MTEQMIKAALNIDKSDWTLVKLGDVVAEPRDTVKDIQLEGIEHVVGLEHIDTEDIHLRRSANIEEETTFTKKFSKGDVLFGRRRAYLKKAAQATFSGICSGDITVLRAKKGLMPELLPFIINNDKFFDYAVKHSAGGLSPRVKFKDLADYQFLLPPKAQQAKIAELLWAMDEVIEKERGVLEKTLTTRLSIEKSFFEKEDLKANTKSEDFFDKITDGTHDTPKKQSSGYKLLTSKNINENKLDLNTDYFIDEFSYHEVNKRSKVDKNDILFGMIGTVGQVCRVVDEPDYAIKNMGLFKTSNLNSSKVAYYYLKSTYFQEYLASKLSGTTQKYVSLGFLRDLKLPDPENFIVKNWVAKEEEFDLIFSRINSKTVNSKFLQKSLINQIF